MKTYSSLIALFLAAFAVPACSSSDANTDETHSDGNGGSGGDENDAGDEEDASEDLDGEDAGPDGAGGSGGGSNLTCGTDEPICAEVEAGFDEQNPGFFGSFDLGLTLMMGNRFGFVAAYFQDTAREDYCKEAESKIALDTCVVVDPNDRPTPQCTSDDQCSPEQQCRPRTNDGNPIPCTEHCQTPRSPIDIGPIEVSGFKDGAITLEASAQDSNGYKAPGDGTIPAAKFAFDTTYVVKGEGDAEKGVSGFQGEVELGPELTIVSPTLEEIEADVGIPGFPPFPTLGVVIDPAAELELKWTGGDGTGEISLELSSADMNASRGHIKCRLVDDGEFTISADLIKALNLGDSAFLNNMNIERVTKGTLTGDSFTRYEVNSRQVLLVNMQKKAEETEEPEETEEE